MAHAAARAGLGIAIFPEFACASDIARGRLIPILERWVVAVGSVSLVVPANRYLAANVRAFVELAVARVSTVAPSGFG
jgi:DNA-binding transcriptional LysR family regulator